MKPKTFTFDIKPEGDHLKITIPEIGITILTDPGKNKRDDATDAAMIAVETYLLKKTKKGRKYLRRLKSHKKPD